MFGSELSGADAVNNETTIHAENGRITERAKTANTTSIHVNLKVLDFFLEKEVLARETRIGCVSAEENGMV